MEKATMNDQLNIITNNPWAGTSSYQDPETSDVQLKFCGRDNESYDVANLIDNNIFVTLYGKSGTGKTSLLNAGVFPRLRRSAYFPISIRLGMEAIDISFQQCIITKIESAISKKGKWQTVEAVPMPDNEDATDYLWSYFACRRFVDNEGNVLFPVIVLDQFEEVLRSKRKEVGILLRQIYFMMDETHALSDRIVDGIPYSYDFNFRFVVSIREDDLYRLEDCIDNNYLLNMKRCRFRLRNMSKDGAREVILEPGGSLFLEDERELIAETIIHQIAPNQEDDGVSTNILSLVCCRLFIEYQHLGKPNITMSLVEKFVKGNPFEKFYREATAGLSRREKSYIEDNLVDSEGRRNSIPESDFSLHVKNGSVLFEGDKRILQRTSTSSSDGNCRIELIHDSFCAHLAMLKKKREKVKKLKFWSTVIAIAFVYVIAGVYLMRQDNRISEQDKQLNVQKAQLASHKLQIEKKDKDLLNYSDKLNKEEESLSLLKDSLSVLDGSLQKKEYNLILLKNSLFKKENELQSQVMRNNRLVKDSIKQQKRFNEMLSRIENGTGSVASSDDKDDFLFEDYDSDGLTESQIEEWKGKYHDLCKEKISNNMTGYFVPDDMINNHPCLIYLILNSKSIADHKEKQSWFDLYSLMNDEQIYKLYDIIYREKRKRLQNDKKYQKKQAEIERKYNGAYHLNGKKSAFELNNYAYEQAEIENWGTAFAAINTAIDLEPQEANYYDSKGELLLMRDKPGDEQEAVKMWKKVMELDPSFLDKHKGSTPLYEKLKKLGLIGLSR
jgi:hypothetical protein